MRACVVLLLFILSSAHAEDIMLLPPRVEKTDHRPNTFYPGARKTSDRPKSKLSITRVKEGSEYTRLNFTIAGAAQPMVVSYSKKQAIIDALNNAVKAARQMKSDKDEAEQPMLDVQES